jgi:hypothetical protein
MSLPQPQFAMRYFPERVFPDSLKAVDPALARDPRRFACKTPESCCGGNRR